MKSKIKDTAIMRFFALNDILLTACFENLANYFVNILNVCPFSVISRITFKGDFCIQQNLNRLVPRKPFNVHDIIGLNSKCHLLKQDIFENQNKSSAVSL